MSTSMHDTIKDYRDSRASGCSVAESIHFVADVRGRLAWAVKDAGWALIHAGNHVGREEPTTLDDMFEPGYRAGYRAGSRGAVASG